MKKKLIILNMLLALSCNKQTKIAHVTNENVLEIELISSIFSNQEDEYIEEDCKCISEVSKLILYQSGSLKSFI